MGTLGVVLLVAFVIVCVLLVLLVLIQDSGENGMGGLMGGRSTAAFGSHSTSVLSKATFVLVVLFFVLGVGIALTLTNNKKDIPDDLIGDSKTAVETTADAEPKVEDGHWWEENENAVIEAADETEAVAEEVEAATEEAEAAVEEVTTDVADSLEDTVNEIEDVVAESAAAIEDINNAYAAAEDALKELGL